MGKKYDTILGKWVDVPENNSPAENSGSPSNTPQTAPNPVVTTKAEGQATQAQKNFDEQSLTYLTGDAEVSPNSITLAVQAGETAELSGLGKHLSGLYFVTEVTTDITASGVTLKYTVLRNGFGKTLKPYTVTNQEVVNTTALTSCAVGDKVKFIENVPATYSNASEGVKVPEWVKKKSHTVQKVSEDGERVLLKEIVSWTYVKFLQKV